MPLFSRKTRNRSSSISPARYGPSSSWNLAMSASISARSFGSKAPGPISTVCVSAIRGSPLAAGRRPKLAKPDFSDQVLREWPSAGAAAPFVRPFGGGEQVVLVRAVGHRLGRRNRTRRDERRLVVPLVEGVGADRRPAPVVRRQHRDLVVLAVGPGGGEQVGEVVGQGRARGRRRGGRCALGPDRALV